MKKIVKFLVCSVLLLGMSPSGDANGTRHLIVLSPRPLENALKSLQGSFNCSVSFEDAPYEARTRMHQLFPNSPQLPKIRLLTLEYQQNEDSATVLGSLLDEYREVDCDVVFSLQTDQEQKNMFHVIPERYVNQNGSWTNYTSILDHEITLNIKAGTFWEDDILNICSILSHYSTEVVPQGEFHGGNPTASPMSLRTNGQAWLASLMNDQERLGDAYPMSWSIRRVPVSSKMDDFVVLSLSKVPSKGEDVGDYSMIIESRRPLSDALRILEPLVNCSVIYEDIEYVCPNDLLSDRTGKPQVPSGGRLEYTFDVNTNAFDVIVECVKAYNRQNHTGEFTTKLVGESIYVFPTKARDASGKYQPQQALLETTMFLRVADKTVENYLNKIVLKAGSATNKKIICEKLQNVLAATEVELSSDVIESAVHALSEVSAQTGQCLSWQLLYEPQERAFTLKGITKDKGASLK